MATSSGGTGNDSILGSASADSISGNAGSDTIDGYGGDDSIYGGAGNDTLYGGGQASTEQLSNGKFSSGYTGWSETGGGIFSGTNYLFDANNTNGTLSYGTTLTGLKTGPATSGAAKISFDFAWNDSNPASLAGVTSVQVRINGVTYATISTPSGDGTQATITYSNGATGPLSTVGETNAYVGPSTNISINLPASVPDSGALTFYTNAAGYDDIVLSNFSVLTNQPAPSGNDLIDGGDGDDSVAAGDGNDTIYGGAGADRLDGGANDDALSGGAGNDSLSGGDGNDVIHMGSSTDAAYGGIGNDQFHVDIAAVGGSVDGGENAGDHDVLDLTAWGHPRTNIIYDDNNPENGKVQFLDAQGAVLSTMSFSNIEKVVACFTPGTRILTIDGEIAVEDLCEGDMVLTRDSGYQPIRWIGRRDLPVEALIANPKLNPIQIRAGSLPNGMPRRTMFVSPQHRMLISDPAAELMFGESEVLVAAIHLLCRPGIRKVRTQGISYIHFMFDQHEIVLADGAWSESFQPGIQTLCGLDQDQRDEIYALFPELAEPNSYPAARLTLRMKEAKMIFAQ